MRRVPLGAVVLVGAMIGMFVVTGWFGSTQPPQVAASVDPAAPFKGTPAQDWADGAEGVVIPPVEPVGKQSVTEITAAYQQARDVIIAAMLDQSVIQGRDDEPYLDRFAKEERFGLRLALADPARRSTFVVSLPPDTTLLPAPPKVRGRMAAESTGEGKVLVRTRFVVAYPLATAEGPKVEIGRLDIDLTVVGAGRPAVDRGVWLSQSDGFSTDCDRSHPSVNGVTPTTSKETLVLSDAVFDPDRPIEPGVTCDR